MAVRPSHEAIAHPDVLVAMHPGTVPLLVQLRNRGVEVVVYGSQGVAMHLGRFKVPGDLDLLVEDEWVGRRIDRLTAILGTFGFSASDASEHEYRNEAGFEVAFTAQSILQRDGVAIPDEDPFVSVRVGGEILRTLSASAFRRAYAFSLQDGYRLEQRGKNDAQVLALLDAHIAHATSLDA